MTALALIILACMPIEDVKIFNKCVFELEKSSTYCRPGGHGEKCVNEARPVVLKYMKLEKEWLKISQAHEKLGGNQAKRIYLNEREN